MLGPRRSRGLSAHPVRVTEMTSAPTAPSVFEYLDFRAYLQDYYKWAKGGRRGFSYRRFSQLAGLRSPNFLKLVIDGDRNIGPSSLSGITSALRMNKGQAQFFEDLVAFGQAKTPEQTERAYGRVSACRVRRKVVTLEGGLYDYFTHWYYPAIRELAAREDFRDDPEWVGRQLLPPVNTAQAKQALSVLKDLGLLQPDDHGRLQRAETSVTTGPEVRRRAFIGYHHQMLQRSAESIGLVPQPEREISALTVCISPDTFARLKLRLQDVLEEVMDTCDADADPRRVYQLNFQLFPLSKSGDE